MFQIFFLFHYKTFFCSTYYKNPKWINMCIVYLDSKIWPLDSDLVHVSAMPPSVALIKAVERFACFVSLYFFWMHQSVGWGVARKEEEEQLNWTRRRKAWVPLPATHLTSSCLIIFLHKIYTFTMHPSIGQWRKQLYTFKVNAEDCLSVSLLACPFISPILFLISLCFFLSFLHSLPPSPLLPSLLPLCFPFLLSFPFALAPGLGLDHKGCSEWPIASTDLEQALGWAMTPLHNV